MDEYAELELSLDRQGADSFAVELRLSLPDSDAERRSTSVGHHIAIDELRQLVTDPAAYGRRLGQDVFTVPGVREALAVVQSRGIALRFRLSIAPTDTKLHGLRWEALADPNAPSPGAPLLMSERLLFSRYVDSSDWRPVTPRAKGDLRALIVVANPSDLARYRLAPVDVSREFTRARNGMTEITSIEVLGERDRASMQNILDRLRTGPDILYLVCHGAFVGGKSALWLEHEDGTTDRRDGQEVVFWLGELKQPPRLVVLVSCQSAGTGDGNAPGPDVTAQDEAWTALGPQLGQAGIPAVLAMQGNVSMATVEAFMPVFFRELQRDGQIDRAVALARGAVRDRHDAWAPVLYMRLKSGRLWSEPQSTAGSPLPDRERPVHTLPAQPTPLIGRDAELTSLHQLLTTSEARLITLTGPGGIGKTRLAIQAAADAVSAFPDGVWWVPLAALTDPALVVQAIASALGVGEVAGEPLLETLGQQLRARQTLLLLDNLEQVIKVAPLIARLLDAAPGLRVLATSRAPLRLRAEQEVPVAPLSLPPETPGTLSLTVAQASPAVQLFVARAQAVKPRFTLDASTAPTIAAICRRLDGLPLAIELAAARIRILPPDQLLNRLDERLQLLTGGSRDLPARQQTLRATIAWSHDLLEPAEQSLFACLAVFAGGCTLAAAEVVCGASGGPCLDVLDGLDSLTQQSVLRQEVGSGGVARFTMLQTILEFARERLDELPGVDELRQRHADTFFALAADSNWDDRSRQRELLDLLEDDHANLRQATEFYAEQGESGAPQVVSLVAKLAYFWWKRGHLNEGRRLINRALALPADIAPLERAAALWGAALLAEGQGDLERAQRLYEEALALRREHGDMDGIARSLTGLGVIARQRGDLETARAHHQEALNAWRCAGNAAGTASALLELGIVSLFEGDYAGAEPALRECLGLFRQLHDDSGEASSLQAIGILAMFTGDLPQAIERFEESLQRWRALSNQQMIATDLGNLGEARQLSGALDDAERNYQEALALFESLDDPAGRGFALRQLGRLALERGDIDAAQALLIQSLRLSWSTGERGESAETLEALAEVSWRLGDRESAAELLRTASVLRDETGVARQPVYEERYQRVLQAVSDFAPNTDRINIDAVVTATLGRPPLSLASTN